MTDLVLIGRSSSHFSRITRLFALELGVPFTFRPLFDLTSVDLDSYAGNPALKIPVLIDEEGSLFGTENICRAIVRRSGRASEVVQRGEHPSRLVQNVEETTLNVMTTEVAIIMGRMGGAAPTVKLQRSLDNALRFLDDHVDAALEALPAARALSFLEAALFAVATHLPFREVSDVSSYVRIAAFVTEFGQRASAQRTTYHFDAP